MPVVPQFQSAGEPGQAFNRGLDSGMSMMERAQQMQLRAGQEQRQKVMEDLALPVIRAKQQADAAAAINQLDQIKANQNLRQKYLPIIDTARAAFHEAQLIPDINQRAAANTQWLAQYAPIANLPEYSNEFQTYQHLATQTTQDQMKIAHLSSVNDMNAAKLSSLQQIAGIRATSAENVANIREKGLLDASTIKAGASTHNAEVRAGAETTEMKNIGAYAKAVASGDEASAEMMQHYLESKSGMAPTHIADSLTKMADNEEKLAGIAKANGDDAGYSQRTANVDHLRNKASAVLEAPPATSRPSGHKLSPPPAAINYLKSNPGTKDQFDQMYGAGASSKFIGP